MAATEEKKYFEYSQKKIDYLKRKDKKLGIAIDKIGVIKGEVTSKQHIKKTAKRLFFCLLKVLSQYAYCLKKWGEVCTIPF